MSAFSGTHSVNEVVQKCLKGLDADLMSYIEQVLEDMSPNERKGVHALSAVVSPFLIDSEFADEAGAGLICQNMSVLFGGSGSTAANRSGVTVDADDESPQLLSAPVRITSTVIAAKSSGNSYAVSVEENPLLKTLRGTASRSVQQSQRISREQAAAEEALRMEMAAARLAAIDASRKTGRQSNTGVNIDRFSLPHPSGTGDLLSDAQLVLSPGRCYGLIGRNGAGKSTLMRALAGYKLLGLQHLRIHLVEQSVEGNDYSALQWVLNADVERTALLQEEERLNDILHSDVPVEMPPDLVGVNIEIVLQECYERMDAIGVSTAEVRAMKILSGLGFNDVTAHTPTHLLSGGWTMRASLASALYTVPDLLLLDEVML